jgi:hypothetical protein
MRNYPESCFATKTQSLVEGNYLFYLPVVNKQRADNRQLPTANR